MMSILIVNQNVMDMCARLASVSFSLWRWKYLVCHAKASTISSCVAYGCQGDHSGARWSRRLTVFSAWSCGILRFFSWTLSWTLRAWSNRIHLDRFHSSRVHVRFCDYRYRSGNVHTVCCLRELLFHEEEHWIFHCLYQLLAATGVHDLLLCSSFFICLFVPFLCRLLFLLVWLSNNFIIIILFSHMVKLQQTST